MRNGRRVGLVISTGLMLLFVVALPQASAHYWTFLPPIEVTLTNPDDETIACVGSYLGCTCTVYEEDTLIFEPGPGSYRAPDNITCTWSPRRAVSPMVILERMSRGKHPMSLPLSLTIFG